MDKKATTAKEYLKAMLWMLENTGWCKNRFEKINAKGKTVGFCLSGAYERVLGDMGARMAAYNLITDSLTKETKGTSMPSYMVGFNDHRDTKKEDVLRVVRRAIRMATKKAKK